MSRVPPSDQNPRTSPLSALRGSDLKRQALGVLPEQAQAHVVHYKSELKTCPELDAVTAQVVSQVQEIQQAARTYAEQDRDPIEIEQEHTRILTRQLGRIFRGEHGASSRVVKDMGKRIARRFFQSELHSKTPTNKEKSIFLGEQGLYFVLKRNASRLRDELQALPYAEGAAKESALGLLAQMERDLQVGFLSHRSKELNRVLRLFSQVIFGFLQRHLPTRLAMLAGRIVREARTGHQPNSIPYKVLADRFEHFRAAWERALMEEMADFCGKRFRGRVAQMEDVQPTTLAFFDDPLVYGDACAVVSDIVYEKLYSEGFLDLPGNWRGSGNMSRTD